ncbi:MULTISPECIES: IclR family transcriptional regulator [Halococcus]|uniref:Transcriptional regulator, IclR family protein n=1 Tax=Halococcus salifodinae DSM 8989 TaxID=1227456 RepID=M0N6R4_9EURY|nr:MULTISPECIES: IclR family transcriptional regulator [Halococcus]EMA53248.1 transcriptional regulator, IclR family protein [Halococcus salifodinae DSM 8989]
MNDEPAVTKKRIGATETSFAIAELLRDQGGATITTLAEEVGRSKSTVHNHLQTLRESGYVVKDEGTYYLGLGFLDLGNAARQRWNLYEIAKPEMDELVSAVGERAQLMVEEQGRGVYIYQTKAEGGVQTDSHIGATVDLHATAVGKAYLAHLPADELVDLRERLDLDERTGRTLTDWDELERELETIRERGYAFNDEERLIGMRAVGAPVLGDDDEILAAVSVSGPTTRMADEWYREEVPEIVTQAARIIGIRATYS